MGGSHDNFSDYIHHGRTTVQATGDIGHIAGSPPGRHCRPKHPAIAESEALVDYRPTPGPVPYFLTDSPASCPCPVQPPAEPSARTGGKSCKEFFAEIRLQRIFCNRAR